MQILFAEHILPFVQFALVQQFPVMHPFPQFILPDGQPEVDDEELEAMHVFPVDVPKQVLPAPQSALGQQLPVMQPFPQFILPDGQVPDVELVEEVDPDVDDVLDIDPEVELVEDVEEDVELLCLKVKDTSLDPFWLPMYG